MNFERFIADITDNQWAVFGTEVWKDGQLICQWGDTREHRHPIYSATKSITAIGVGMAEDEGKIELDRSVLQYLPEEICKQLSAEQTEVYRHITLERLMTMSVAGYPFRPFSSENGHWLMTSLELPLEKPEERVFEYSNIPTYLVGVATSCALQEDLYTYLNRKLFQPLGIENPPCTRCPDGYFYGASGMELTVNELSRIGLLLAHEGIWENKPLISADFVRRATSIQQMNREGGYGYYIWKYRDGFSINGKWKQKCYVLPGKGLMVTYLADIQDNSHTLKESMERNIFMIS